MKKVLSLFAVLAAISFTVQSVNAQFTLDGIGNEVGYTSVATQVHATSFGDSPLHQVLIGDDGTNFYIFIEGNIDTGGNNRVWLIYVDATGHTGVGSSVVPGNSGGSIQNFGNIVGATLDLPDIDLSFACNNGGGSNIFLDSLRYTDDLGEFVGQDPARAGNALSSGAGASGTLGIDAAFVDDADGVGGTINGLELMIPFTALPGVTSSSTVSIVVSMHDNGNGFMSNQALPALDDVAQPGFGPHNWQTDTPEFNVTTHATTPIQVPVELSTFSIE